MTTTKKTFATLLAAAVFAFAGCTEKENIVPVTPTPNDTTPETPEVVENPLVGTSWTAHLEGSYTYNYGGYNIDMEITDDASLDFIDSTSGELFQDLYIYFPIAPSQSQRQDITEPFTYTINGDSITLSVSYYDEEEDDTVRYSYPAVYDKTANTITVDMEGSGMEEIMGTSQMVFSPREVATKKTASADVETGRIYWKSLPKMSFIMIILESLNRL